MSINEAESNADLESEVFDRLKGMLVDVLGAEETKSPEIHRESRFKKDLEMSDNQVADFATRVSAQYGDRVNFNVWLAKKPLPKLLNLKVGEISEFIAQELQ